MATLEAAAIGNATWADPVLRRKMMIKAVTVSAIGTTIEWYDFFLYGVAAALVFPQKFFPRSDPFGQLLLFTTQNDRHYSHLRAVSNWELEIRRWPLRHEFSIPNS